MKPSTIRGCSFGITSSIVTNLGMIMGLYGLDSRIAIIGGVVSIAIADSISDSLGMHISEESNTENSHRTVWHTTFSTLISKFIFSLSFIAPMLLFPLNTAVTLSIIWGILLLAVMSYFMAVSRKEKPLFVILEHVGIALLVIVLTYFVGIWIGKTFV